MYRITKEVPVSGHYDLAVIGGGPSGLISAITAARLGCRVALAERFGFLGGTAAGGYVLPISGFYLGGRQVVGGIPFEFVKRMEALGGAAFEYPKGNVSFSPEVYKLVAQEMLTEAGVEVYTNAYLTDAAVCDGRILAAILETKSGATAIEADVFADATGDGDLARLAGAEMLPAPAEGLQPMSLCFLLGGVDTTTPLLRDCIHHDGKTGASVNKTIQALLQKEAGSGFARFGGPWFNVTLCGDVLAVNVTRAGADACDGKALQDAEFAMRREMFAIVAVLRRAYREFENCYIISSAPLVGIRETRHIRGAYTMTGDDLLLARRFSDCVALCAHPVDIHNTADGTQICKRLERAAGVPYRAMYSPAVKNLLCPSRCVSAERVAYASLRVQATLMALGQAAGVAAALCRRTGNGDVAAVDTPALLHELHALGGITE